jgi:Zn-dependent protease
MDHTVTAVLAIIVVLLSLTVHEAAHSLVAFLLGDPTARNRGRMSLNPIVHIDPVGTIILPLLLAFTGAGVFGWAKPVPVNIYNLKNPKRDDGLIALAGPASNLLLALFAAVAIRVILLFALHGQLSSGTVFILRFLSLGIQVNIFLMLFNLLPIPPLDGSSILQMFLPAHHSFRMIQLQKYGFLILLVLIFTNILDMLYLSPFGGLFIKIMFLVAGL